MGTEEPVDGTGGPLEPAVMNTAPWFGTASASEPLVSRRARQRWSKEDAVRALARAGTYEFPLAGSTYDRLLALGEVIGPSRMWIIQQFGTWLHACKLARVESLAAPRGHYQSKWTDDDLCDLLADFLSSRANSTNLSDYNAWRRSTDRQAPSAGMLINLSVRVVD